MRFFVGLHQPSDARHFTNAGAFISVHRLKPRRTMVVGDWIMDSGAFSAIATHGGYPHPVSQYAEQIRKWSKTGNLLAAVAQDYMCEEVMLAKTGLTVLDHQRLTIERYDELTLCEDTAGIYIMPVLQGYTAEEYLRCLEMYGDRLKPGMWVGVGSICKRNADVRQIERVLSEIFLARPDLKLHGFGLKSTALKSPLVRALLETADSMAWSYAARKQGRDSNDWREAARFSARLGALQ